MVEQRSSHSTSTTWRSSHVDFTNKLTAIVPHQSRSTARQQTATSSRFGSTLQLLFNITIVLFFFSQIAEASAIPSQLEFRDKETLLIDTSPPPTPRSQIAKRRAHESSATGLTTAVDGTATAEKAASTSSQSSLDSASLPRPFDSTIGNNFTESSCPAFFQKFLSDAEFTACLPLSLLLQTSNGFFTAERSPVLLSQTLDATCNVNVTQCNALMASLAVEIKGNDNCGADYNAQNPMVLQAYDGFVAYLPLYHAGCLINEATGNYCFSDAATNASSPSSSYIYYLPLGIALPSNTQPACSTCLQNTMALFATAASNSSQLLSSDYPSAAELVDGFCGTEFVNASVKVTSGVSSRKAGISLFGPAMLPVLAATIISIV